QVGELAVLAGPDAAADDGDAEGVCGGKLRDQNPGVGDVAGDREAVGRHRLRRARERGTDGGAAAGRGREGARKGVAAALVNVERMAVLLRVVTVNALGTAPTSTVVGVSSWATGPPILGSRTLI